MAVETGESKSEINLTRREVEEFKIEIRDQLLSRETNRGVATVALIEELVDSIKNKRAPNPFAIKGFIFAWLFPRTLIVLGSVIGGMVLIIQAVLLYQQNSIVNRGNDLLQLQTTASELGRIETYKIRIAKASEAKYVAEVLSNFVMPEGLSSDYLGPISTCQDPCQGSMISALESDVKDRPESVNGKSALLVELARLVSVGGALRASATSQAQFLSLPRQLFVECGHEPARHLLGGIALFLRLTESENEMHWLRAQAKREGNLVRETSQLTRSMRRTIRELGGKVEGVIPGMASRITVNFFLAEELKFLEQFRSALGSAMAACERQIVQDSAQLMKISARLP